MGWIGSPLVTSSLGPVAIIDSLARRHPQWASALKDRPRIGCPWAKVSTPAQAPGKTRVDVPWPLPRHLLLSRWRAKSPKGGSSLDSPGFQCVRSVGCSMPSGGEVPRPGATESSVFTTPGISPLPYFRNVCPTLPVAYGVGVSCKFVGVYI